MPDPSRPLKMLAVGVILLMAVALAADVAVNSTNIDLVGEPPGSSGSVLDVEMTGSWPSANAGGFHAPTTGTAVFADAAGGAVALRDLQAMFGGPKRVALGCTAACELVQVVTCYAQGSGAEGDPVGPRERADCPCFGVRDSHYDNSCAEAHACAEVKVLSPEQAGCGGGPRPDACAGGKRCCPGELGPACA